MDDILRLNDAEFLESTDVNFFLSHLLGTLTTSKPENFNDYCEKYFLRVQSCQHVIGSDFGFISGCKHNRRAFLFCLFEVTSGYDDCDDMTVRELQQFMEQLCPDFPSNILMDAAKIIDVKGFSRPPRYQLKDLRLALSFQLLYLEWLREVDRQFTAETTDITRGLPVSKVRMFNEGLYRALPCSVEKPPHASIDIVISTIAGADIGKDEFKRAVFAQPSIGIILSRIKYMAPSLNSNNETDIEEISESYSAVNVDAMS